MSRDGQRLHEKHAYMPNTLGYCGPDENGTIREHLEGGKPGDRLVRALQGFEAAYPFLNLIARNSGRDAFDYAVPEAYWIGNPLLDRVDPADFYRFSDGELRGSGMKNLRGSLKHLDGAAVPHHSFYVMGTYIGAAGDGPKLGQDKVRKIEGLIDGCRISWGRVRRVSKDELAVDIRPIAVGEKGLELGGSVSKKVKYNPLVEPFGVVKAGDVVSMHWGYACEVLTPSQARNIERYTIRDIAAANRLLSARKG